MIKLIMLLPLAIVTFVSCGDPVSNSGGPSGSSHPNASTSSYVAGPVLSSLSSDFAPKTFKIARTSSTSEYLYGSGEIEYTGDTSLAFLRVYAYFKSVNGTVQCGDTTYLYNETVTGFSNYSDLFTTSFVSPEHRTVYYTFIKKTDARLADIDSIEFVVEGQLYSLKTPSPQVVLSGTPYMTNNYINHDVLNMGPDSADVSLSTFIYKNRYGYSYNFSYPYLYIKDVSGDVRSSLLEENQKGRLSSILPSVYFESKPLTIYKVLLSWARVDHVSKRALMAIDDPDERMAEVRRLRDLSIERTASGNKVYSKGGAQ